MWKAVETCRGGDQRRGAGEAPFLYLYHPLYNSLHLTTTNNHEHPLAATNQYQLTINLINLINYFYHLLSTNSPQIHPPIDVHRSELAAQMGVTAIKGVLQQQTSNADVAQLDTAAMELHENFTQAELLSWLGFETIRNNQKGLKKYEENMTYI